MMICLDFFLLKTQIFYLLIVKLIIRIKIIFFKKKENEKVDKKWFFKMLHLFTRDFLVSTAFCCS